MPRIISVSEWGGSKPNMSSKSVPITKRTGFALHYDGGDSAVTRSGYSIPQALTKFHQDTRGWEWGGYNFIVESNSASPTDGAIYEMRGRDIKGAHWGNRNYTTIGVQVAIGKDQVPTQRALEAIVWLYNQCSSAAGRPLEKLVHREDSEECPGRFLSFFTKHDFDVEATLAAGYAIPLTSEESPLAMVVDDKIVQVPTHAVEISQATPQTPAGYEECAAVGETIIGSVEEIRARLSQDFTDRHIPDYYPYTNTLTYQSLLRAAHQEVLTGEDYDQRLQVLHLLKGYGFITRVFPAEGESWLPLFRTAWRKWQESQGMTGLMANGIPKATSVYTLAHRSGLSYWDEETQSNSLTVKQPKRPKETRPPLCNPTDGGVPTIPFGKTPAKKTYWQSFGRHTGTDFALEKAQSRDLFAVDSGEVTYKHTKMLGHVAILRADSLKDETHQYFWYSHLEEPPTTGRVERGQKIGVMGSTGEGSYGDHLHLELQRSGRAWGTTWHDFKDPVPYLDLPK